MLDFIRDMFASFRQSSLERVRSPFLGAFVFSWLGFNWPILAILFFSNREIEKRLVYITDNFGIESYLIGPLCTSALIAYLLPKINKLVTKIQDKPNTETIEMSLESKIKIAKKQQEIAEIDARKKLAEKKGEKYIQESIEQIKKEHKNAISKLEIALKHNKDFSDKVTEITKSYAESQGQLSVEKEARSKIEKELLLAKEHESSLTSQIFDAINESHKVKAEINNLKHEINELQYKSQDLSSYNKHLIDELNFISTSAPLIVSMKNIDGRMELFFNKSIYEKFKENLASSNNTTLLLNNSEDAFSLRGIKLSPNKMSVSPDKKLETGKEEITRRKKPKAQQ